MQAAHVYKCASVAREKKRAKRSRGLGSPCWRNPAFNLPLTLSDSLGLLNSGCRMRRVFSVTSGSIVAAVLLCWRWLSPSLSLSRVEVGLLSRSLFARLLSRALKNEKALPCRVVNTGLNRAGGAVVGATRPLQHEAAFQLCGSAHSLRNICSSS